MTILDFPVAEPEAPAPPSIPHSREAEEGVVGAVLINPECYYEVAEVVAPADFYIHRHRWIMEAVKGLMERKVPVDMLTVSEELDRMGQLAEIGGPAYLTRLIGGVPSSLNAASYARIVKEHEVARRMITAANDIAQLAYDVAKPMDMRMALAEKQWQAIRKDADAKSSRLLGMKDLLSNAWDRMEAIAKLGRPPGIISNFLDMDKILHGFKKGRYYLIAGRPGDGKTALLLTASRNFMKFEHQSVLYFSIEMQENNDFDDPISGGELSERLIGMEADLDTTSISDGRLTDVEYPKFTAAIERMGDWHFTVEDDPSVTPDQMVARARRVKGEIGLDVVIVDYIQIQETPMGMKFGTRAEQVSYLSKCLKRMAKELNVVVLVAAQVNRGYMQRGDKRLVLEDLKESGSLEQDAHVVIFIQPKDQEAVKEVDVAKHRGGKIGTCNLYYAASRTEFRNAAARSDDVEYWWTKGNGNGKH